MFFKFRNDVEPQRPPAINVTSPISAPSAVQNNALRPYLRYFMHNGHDPSAFVDRMNEAQLDALPYGALLLSHEAKILRYNRTEAEITGRSQQAVLGRNFFLELAVCGVGPQFQGRFKNALLSNQFDEIFPYVFHYQMPETVMLVRITLGPIITGNRCVWVFVRRMMPQP